jgi:Na+/H+ antiporter NhaD/arsenite permease-like protein
LPAIVALAILGLTLVLILTEYVHSTVAALLGATLTLLAVKVFGKNFDILYTGEATGVITFGTIVETIGLLLGMMIIVGILSRTGFFQWTALKAFEISKGNAWKLLVMLILFTACLSAFLDNVTTVLLMIPATIELARVLKLDPIPMLISEALASNIGGTATAIGDPPNIMIGAAFQLSFMSFIINIAPIILIIMVVFILLVKVYYKRILPRTLDIKDMDELREKYDIKDKKLFKRSIFIFCIVIVLLVLHDLVNISLAESALIGAVLLLLLSGVDIHEALESVEWTTLLFFGALFLIIVGTVEMGLISVITDVTLNIIGGNPVVAIVLILWITAFISAIIGAIPSTAIMIPIVGTISVSMENLGDIGGVNTLFWALSLGACLGGNGTPLGTAANMVVFGMSERTGHSISFKEFMRVGLPVSMLTVTLAMIYLLIRYVVF